MNDDILPRIVVASSRIQNNEAPMHIPASNNDVDIVLLDSANEIRELRARNKELEGAIRELLAAHEDLRDTMAFIGGKKAPQSSLVAKIEALLEDK